MIEMIPLLSQSTLEEISVAFSFSCPLWNFCNFAKLWISWIREKWASTTSGYLGIPLPSLDNWFLHKFQSRAWQRRAEGGKMSPRAREQQCHKVPVFAFFSMRFPRQRGHGHSTLAGPFAPLSHVFIQMYAAAPLHPLPLPPHQPRRWKMSTSF